jgi:anti-sigma B factor antagonist
MTHWPEDHDVADFDRAWYRVDPMAGCAVVTAGGEIDVQTSSGLHKAVEVALASTHCIVFDLSRVSFVDSSGFGVLIVASNRARQLGGSVVLVSPPEMVRKILAGTQLQQAFAVRDRLEDAVASFSGT